MTVWIILKVPPNIEVLSFTIIMTVSVKVMKHDDSVQNFFKLLKL